MFLFWYHPSSRDNISRLFISRIPALIESPKQNIPLPLTINLSRTLTIRSHQTISLTSPQQPHNNLNNVPAKDKQ